MAATFVGVTALAKRCEPSEALRLASSLARALEAYLSTNGGAVSRAQLAGVVRTWVPRWDADVPPLLTDALIEVLCRQGKVVATRHYVGTVAAVEQWRLRFVRSPQRLVQPADLVAHDFDVPLAAVLALRVLAR